MRIAWKRGGTDIQYNDEVTCKTKIAYSVTTICIETLDPWLSYSLQLHENYLVGNYIPQLMLKHT